jgi:hypothetical protein
MTKALAVKPALPPTVAELSRRLIRFSPVLGGPTMLDRTVAPLPAGSSNSRISPVRKEMAELSLYIWMIR